MPWRLKRFQATGYSYFVTFSCYHRQPLFTSHSTKRIFETALERTRHKFGLRIYAYVVIPEHIHILVSEPERGTLAEALKSLKQGVSRRLIVGAPFKPGFGLSGDFAKHFWQKRYYDLNIRNYDQFLGKRRYTHRNPVKADSVSVRKIGCGAVFASARQDVKDEWRSSASGPRESVNEPQAPSVLLSNYPTQANTGLEWATSPVPPDLLES